MDSGDLLTTCAGSGATLVAIIGGFLLTRYMAVEAEIRGADRLVQQAVARLTVAETRVETERRNLCGYDVDKMFADETFIEVLVRVTEQGGNFTARTARDLLPLDKFSDEDIEYRLKAWRAETLRATRSNVWAVFPERPRYPSLADFLDVSQTQMEIEPIWAHLYDRAKDEHRQTNVLGINLEIDGFEVVDLDAPRRSAFEARLHEAEVSRDVIAAEVQMARGIRLAISKPDGLRWEVLVLLIVAVLTIVPSLLLLAPYPNELTKEKSTWVVGLFLAGFAMLIGYLMTHANRAQKAWGTGSVDRVVGEPDGGATPY